MSTVIQPVSVGLKFGFLIALYLFLFWVATSTLFDMRRQPGARSGTIPPGDAEATSMHPVEPLASGDFEPRLLVERAAGHQSGIAYDLSHGATLGRGDVEIQLDDPYASSRHARITRQGHTLVIEDLGSTNGTYLNDSPLSGPQPLHEGDRIRIGDSEFSFLQ